jgi:hypothetical protein
MYLELFGDYENIDEFENAGGNSKGKFHDIYLWFISGIPNKVTERYNWHFASHEPFVSGTIDKFIFPPVYFTRDADLEPNFYAAGEAEIDFYSMAKLQNNNLTRDDLINNMPSEFNQDMEYTDVGISITYHIKKYNKIEEYIDGVEYKPRYVSGALEVNSGFFTILQKNIENAAYSGILDSELYHINGIALSHNFDNLKISGSINLIIPETSLTLKKNDQNQNIEVSGIIYEKTPRKLQRTATYFIITHISGVDTIDDTENRRITEEHIVHP